VIVDQDAAAEAEDGSRLQQTVTCDFALARVPRVGFEDQIAQRRFREGRVGR
jgi:hypothetical protein